MYDKKFFEKYAVLSLIRFYNSDLESIILNGENYESPDFQSEYLDIGIEVTEAISPKQGQERFMINEYFGKGLDGEAIKIEVERRFGKCIIGKINSYDGMTIFSEYSGMTDTKEHLDAIGKSIISKTNKLNNLYKIFNENWLYVYTHTSIIGVDDLIPLLSKWFSNYGINYNKIFLNCINKIYVINSNSILSIIELDKLELNELKVDASN